MTVFIQFLYWALLLGLSGGWFRQGLSIYVMLISFKESVFISGISVYVLTSELYSYDRYAPLLLTAFTSSCVWANKTDNSEQLAGSSKRVVTEGWY